MPYVQLPGARFLAGQRTGLQRGSFPSKGVRKDAQEPAVEEAGGRRPGHLQGVCFFPVLPGQGGSEHRAQKKGRVQAAVCTLKILDSDLILVLFYVRSESFIFN